MQIIKQNQLDEVLQSYLASNPTKPLLVWFEDNPTIDKYLKEYISKKGVGRTEGHPMWGHKQAVVNGEFVKPSEHPELLANDIYTDSVRNADWVLYHRYTEQLSKEPLTYCINLQKNLHKPVVCFVNTYSKAEQSAVDTSFIESNFDDEFIVRHDNSSATKNCFVYKIDDDILTYDYEIDLTRNLDELGVNHDFTLLDIYKITLWKLKRFPYVEDKDNFMQKFNHLASYSTLTPKAEEEAKDVLMLLLSTRGIRLPMASTYLRFRNPNLFQIMDQRVWRIIQQYLGKTDTDYPYLDDVDSQIDKYFNYLKDLRTLANKKNIQFRDADRAFYEWDIKKGNKLKRTSSKTINGASRKSNQRVVK